MAAETALSAFTPVVFNDSMNGYGVNIHAGRPSSNNDEGHDCDNNTRSLRSAAYKKRSEMNDIELATARERDRIQSKKRREHAELKRLEMLKEHEIRGNEVSVLNNINALAKEENTDSCDSKKSKNDVKKRRNVRKRNRSDMSPDELKRLRERERKAQQSRRDRIRAQKKQGHGWHDDDAAWEAFLDQTETSNESTATKSSVKKEHNSVPSMVCNISPRNDRILENNSPNTSQPSSNKDSLVNASLNYQDCRELQVSTPSNDTESINSGCHSTTYSSDENSQEVKENGTKRLSRRHYLPSEELERLRKRERDAKRKQREKHRQANMDLMVDQKEPVKSENKLEPEPAAVSKHEQKEQTIKNEQKEESAEQVTVSSSSPIQDNHTLALSDISPKPCLTSPSMFHSPHSHGQHHYSPVVYMPDRHHHYSPHSHYINEGRHYPDLYYPHHITDDRHYHSDSHHHAIHDLHSRHHFSGHVSAVLHQPRSTSTASSLSPEHKPKQSMANSILSQGSNEKKKMISRNVDRKKLTEEELEELRRRERDYQRERRARIRMEKAKSQATHEQYQQSVKENMPHYYHPSQMYHSMHRHDDLQIHLHEKAVHRMIPRYEEDRFEYHHLVVDPSHHHHSQESKIDHRHAKDPSQLEKELEDRATQMFENGKELAVSIPSDARFDKMKLDLNSKESELLQVVPKNRDCEDLRTKLSPEDLTSNINKSSKSQTKKNLLENICSSLKKESIEWLEDDDDDKLVIVQPNNDVTKWENSSKISSLHSEDNLAKLKAELTNGFKTSSQNKRREMSIEDRLQCMKEGINEDQLERRRRSNREAQRRRRARLKMQGGSEDQLDSSLDYSGESNEFDLIKEKMKISSYEDEKLSNRLKGKGCRVKVTPARPGSLYPEETRPHHLHHIEHDHHGHDKYGHYIRDSSYMYPDKHFYHNQYSMRDIDNDIHSHYHHEPSYIAERYGHEHLARYHYASYYERDRYMHSEKHRDFDHKQIDAAQHHHSSSSSTKDIDDTEIEPLKQSGRKRKQFAPRKIISSTTTSPDEDVDVLNVSKSPEEQNNKLPGEEESMFNNSSNELMLPAKN